MASRADAVYAKAAPFGGRWSQLPGHLALILAVAAFVFVAATRTPAEPTPGHAVLDPARCAPAGPSLVIVRHTGTYIGTKIYATVPQVVCHDERTAIRFDQVELGGAQWDPDYPTRLTADRDGVWQVTAGSFVNDAPSEDIWMGFRRNGTDLLRGLRTQTTPTAWGGYLGTNPTTVELRAGDYVEFVVYQDDAYDGSEPLQFGHDATHPEAQSWMELRYLGD